MSQGSARIARQSIINVRDIGSAEMISVASVIFHANKEGLAHGSTSTGSRCTVALLEPTGAVKSTGPASILDGAYAKAAQIARKRAERMQYLRAASRLVNLRRPRSDRILDGGYGLE